MHSSSTRGKPCNLTRTRHYWERSERDGPANVQFSGLVEWMIGNINEARFGSAILPLAAYSYNSVLKALRANDARIRASPMLFLASMMCALPAANGVVPSTLVRLSALVERWLRYEAPDGCRGCPTRPT